MRYDPPQFHPTHSHRCIEPHCTARVACASRRCRECEDAHCEIQCQGGPDMLCEDHRDMPPCDWCGEREGEPLVDYDGDRMHPTCAAEAVAW